MKIPFEIIAVHYGFEHKRIEAFQVKQIYTGLKIFVPPMTIERVDLIFRFKTAWNLFVKDNPYDLNPVEVHLVNVDGYEFFRTDANSVASDNLGNLPEF